MTTTNESLHDQLDAREADLAIIRGKRTQVTRFDLASLRVLRREEADAEADIGELRAEIERQAAWSASPERLERLSKAKAELGKAEKEFADAAKAWLALERWFAEGALIATDLAGLHAAAAAHLSAAVRSRFPDPHQGRERETVLLNLLPAVRGDSSSLAKAVAAGLRGVIAELPCGGKVLGEYLLPNELDRLRTDGGRFHVAATVAAARAMFADRAASLSKPDAA